MIDIAIIGNGNHSKRIQNILKKNKKKFLIYKPNKNQVEKKKLNLVKKCNIIFICSPNHTHYFYIKEFYQNRYIFCEKPPVSKKRDLSALKKIDHKKIYFNFNQRHSALANILRERKKYNLGNLIYGNRICSHGLAFKKEYEKSWRANFLKCKKGVFEIVSVHDLDIVNYFFEIDKIKKPRLINFQKKGTSFDTSFVNIKLKNSGEINIFSSYSSSFRDEWVFMFENGIIQLDDKNLYVSGPTKNYNKDGFFIKPKNILKKKLNGSDYNESLIKSVSFFLNKIKKKKYFKKKDFDKSLETNSYLFN